MIVRTEHSGVGAQQTRSHTSRDRATDMVGVPNAAPYADHAVIAIATALLGRDWS